MSEAECVVLVEAVVGLGVVLVEAVVGLDVALLAGFCAVLVVVL